MNPKTNELDFPKLYVVCSSDGQAVLCNSRQVAAQAVVSFSGKEVVINEVSNIDEASAFVDYHRAELKLRPMLPSSYRDNFMPLEKPRNLFTRLNERISMTTLESGDTLTLEIGGGSQHE